MLIMRCYQSCTEFLDCIVDNCQSKNLYSPYIKFMRTVADALANCFVGNARYMFHLKSPVLFEVLLLP